MKTTTTDFLLDLFDHVRDANVRVAEMAAANAEKDRRNASMAEKVDVVLENQRQQRLDLESWLAKERRWNKERDGLLKTIKYLNDIVKDLRKAKVVGPPPLPYPDRNIPHEGNIQAEVPQGILP